MLWVGTRWYLQRAPAGYLWERAAYATLAGTVGETVEGGRTIEALGLNEERVRRVDGDLREAYRAERRTLFLRTVWFPTAEFAYVLPVAAALAWGGWLVSNGHATIGEVTAVALYVVQLADPVDRLISWLDEIQVGATSFARLVGIATRAARPHGDRRDPPRTSTWSRTTCATRTSTTGTSCTASTSTSSRASASRSSARPAPASRRSGGCSPASTRRAWPRRRRRRPARRPAARDAAPGGRARHAGAARLRRHARREPAARATRRERRAAARGARRGRRARVGATRCREGLETVVGAGGYPLTPPQAQQLALARLVLADPHTLVLDEATSLLDPRAARHLERSLASVLDGRTVVAIAHRLHTAHDADRVAVVEDGLLRSSARTTSSSPAAARTPRSGSRGTSERIDDVMAEARAEIAAGRVPDAAALRARIRAEGGGGERRSRSWSTSSRSSAPARSALRARLRRPRSAGRRCARRWRRRWR